jgi:hypothetical protein
MCRILLGAGRVSGRAQLALIAALSLGESLDMTTNNQAFTFSISGAVEVQWLFMVQVAPHRVAPFVMVAAISIDCRHN